MSKLVCIIFLLITVELVNAQQYYSNPSSAYLMGYPYGSYSGGYNMNRYPSYSNMMYSNGQMMQQPYQYQQQQYPYGSSYGYSGYNRPYQYSSSSYMSSYPSYAYGARSYQPSSPLASVSLFCANCSRG
uniref:Uncharacterized protein n=1 Tax=Panagrolaimus sp. ES5 TaxID=591445 RepID=A0AC34GUC5_9BILA